MPLYSQPLPWPRHQTRSLIYIISFVLRGGLWLRVFRYFGHEEVGAQNHPESVAWNHTESKVALGFGLSRSGAHTFLLHPPPVQTPGCWALRDFRGSGGQGCQVHEQGGRALTNLTWQVFCPIKACVINHIGGKHNQGSERERRN